ncbi:restriction endonuclease subunit S [Gallibacterium salpingitidis]|uniref:restriction endonuclease subunit S n=1 Tax=Gallibacterium salpingitidis TaxID=505341 RepID=UPI0018D343A6|nr:restriction endonuclease subunit S [Gallibacterium salpingitidis]
MRTAELVYHYIVKEVEKWFAVIEQLEKDKIDLAQAIKQAKSKILDLAIRGKLLAQDPNDEPAEKLLKRINPNWTPMDNSHYPKMPFELPKGWVWCKLQDVSINELGKTLDKSKNTGKFYDYLCSVNVKWGHIDLSLLKKMRLEEHEKERYRVKKGDLLICEGGDVGRSAICNFDKEIYYQNALHRVRFKNNIKTEFYFYVLWLYKEKSWIDDVSSGVTIKHFTQNSINKLIFPFPPLAEQQRIVEKIEILFTELDNIQHHLK